MGPSLSTGGAAPSAPWLRRELDLLASGAVARLDGAHRGACRRRGRAGFRRGRAPPRRPPPLALGQLQRHVGAGCTALARKVNGRAHAASRTLSVPKGAASSHADRREGRTTPCSGAFAFFCASPLRWWVPYESQSCTSGRNGGRRQSLIAARRTSPGRADGGDCVHGGDVCLSRPQRSSLVVFRTRRTAKRRAACTRQQEAHGRRAGPHRSLRQDRGCDQTVGDRDLVPMVTVPAGEADVRRASVVPLQPAPGAELRREGEGESMARLS